MGEVTAETHYRFAVLGAEAVYDAWLDPARIKVWMTHMLRESPAPGEVTTIAVDARVGGQFMFADVRDGEASQAWGTYRVLERPERMVFSWFVSAAEEQEDKSLVSLRLEQRTQGCSAHMTHQMSDAWADYVGRTAAAWHAMHKAIEETMGR